MTQYWTCHLTRQLCHAAEMCLALGCYAELGTVLELGVEIAKGELDGIHEPAHNYLHSVRKVVNAIELTLCCLHSAVDACSCLFAQHLSLGGVRSILH
jgi:hypothetical protein